jgi:hypothetical protein
VKRSVFQEPRPTKLGLALAFHLSHLLIYLLASICYLLFVIGYWLLAIVHPHVLPSPIQKVPDSQRRPSFERELFGDVRLHGVRLFRQRHRRSSLSHW